MASRRSFSSACACSITFRASAMASFCSLIFSSISAFFSARSSRSDFVTLGAAGAPSAVGCAGFAGAAPSTEVGL